MFNYFEQNFERKNDNLTKKKERNIKNRELISLLRFLHMQGCQVAMKILYFEMAIFAQIFGATQGKKKT